MVRDDVHFNTALSADILYTSNARGCRPPSPANNNHYAMAETQRRRPDGHPDCRPRSRAFTARRTPATAGLFTTRGLASSFFINGTNRAMFRFTMIAHLCNDLPAMEDTTRPPDRIRQDVGRSPGGDSRCS